MLVEQTTNSKSAKMNEKHSSRHYCKSEEAHAKNESHIFYHYSPDIRFVKNNLGIGKCQKMILITMS